MPKVYMPSILKAVLSLALLLGLLSGCATFGRWGYETLPTWMMWRVQSYLDLEGEPKALARRHLDALHQWHQSTQLKPLLASVRQVRSQVEAGRYNAGMLKETREALAEDLEPLLDQAAPKIAEVALRLEGSQLARMRREFDKDNDKLRRERLQGSATERAEARAKRYIERAEFFLGDLNAAQRQLIRERSSRWPPVEQQWYEQRLARQQELLALLERLRTERPALPVASRLMREHLNRYLQWREGAEREGTVNSMAAGDALLIELLGGITPRQKQHLLERLDDWISTLEKLASQRPA
ncbi:MAG: hypothetical protein RLZ51_1160 [Pseudomonadota bacterium]